ncbi:MAG TPA: DUF1858 domain-containing protein [Bacteroidales bacterium]|nr:DUF1858 domain-containing protein [Bacteroidales bacterium]
MITPRTKILEILTQYPDLEPALIEKIPAFKKLQNPFLRKTVAKVATVQQAAAIAGIDVNELVRFLRQETGQECGHETEGEALALNHVRPDWFSEGRVADTLDVRPMLSAGEHPVHEVIGRLRQLPQGGILKAIFPFLPVPLIEKASSLGFPHWIEEEDKEVLVVWFHMPEGNA